MDKPVDTHAKYAPSAAHRWLACHGSVALSEGFKDHPSSYAEEGTECHTAAALVLQDGSWDEATKDLSEEQTEIVEEYTNYVFDLINELFDKGLQPKLWVEQKVSAPEISPQFSGTLDCGILAGSTLQITDLKAGYMPVEVTDKNGWHNPQLASYVVQFLSTHNLWDRVKKVKLAIVQPRVYDKPQIVTFPIYTFVKFAEYVGLQIKEIEAGDKHLTAGEHCTFCPAKGRCPELRAKAIQKAKMVFDCPKEAREYTNEEIGEILNEADMIQAHVEGVRQYAMRELEKGRQVPGWKLVPKRAAYKWTDWEAAKKQKELLGFEVYTFKPKTPLQIKKILKNAKLPEEIVDPYFVKESSGNTLAREDDKREAVKPDPFRD